jgi:transposase
MLADELDFVVGVDPHRDAHALAIVNAATGAALFEVQVTASESGYAQALRLAEREAPGRRAWAIEGTGSYGAGLARFLTARRERVLEVGRIRRERRSHAKTDALDALRAARCVLGEAELASPRAAGEREALRALMVARAGALAAKKAGLCQLRALLVTCPEPLRSELRSLTRGAAAPSPSGGAPGPASGRGAARHADRAARARPPRAGAHGRGTRAQARD